MTDGKAREQKRRRAMTKVTIGSEAHKELFCREFIDTHLQINLTE
jgi:hypothetical protein